MGVLKNRVEALFYYVNNKIKIVTSENRPIDSANPAPINIYLDSFGSEDGFLAMLSIALAKMFPSPSAAPKNPNAVKPIPINFKASNSILTSKKLKVKN